MPNYADGKIYCIRNRKDSDKIVYVGSTTQTLANRMCKHRRAIVTHPIMKLYKLFTEVGIEHFHIELIADFPCDRKEQLTAEEGRFIRLHQTMVDGCNMRLEGQTNEEWRAANKDVLCERLKAYNIANRDKIAASRKASHQRHKEKRNAASRAYHEDHREASIAKSRAYYEENREALLEQKRNYRMDNIDFFKAKDKAYGEAHREELIAKSKAYYESNKAELLEKAKVYREAHKDMLKANCLKRKALKNLSLVNGAPSIIS